MSKLSPDLKSDLRRMERRSRSLSTALKAFTADKRIFIIELLAERDRSVTELCDATGVSQPNVSQQLAVLKKQGLVKARREGRTIRYRLNRPKLQDLYAQIGQSFGVLAPALRPAAPASPALAAAPVAADVQPGALAG
ncbi:ArsR/SmtB family transcription factor [Chthonobacter rhizosphaerae]|uniref:ArsR/SmtB family transcription factor n=1 Tax=Chthonobacter rhizosphaerae TaxID=2735553 RepID=UPI0015EF711E|nr:metalloregulator ArsR/SmtB family transcription factor [Chthonobacter rhizosphaerae]